MDCSELMDNELPVDEFLEVFVEKLKNLLSHHFIYKQQESFLKNQKETLEDNECVIILQKTIPSWFRMPFNLFTGITLSQ